MSLSNHQNSKVIDESQKTQIQEEELKMRAVSRHSRKGLRSRSQQNNNNHHLLNSKNEEENDEDNYYDDFDDE